MLPPLRPIPVSEGGVVAYPFVESPNMTPARTRAIDVVVMHTMEIAERKDAAEICARWFRSPASKVSAHYCVDGNGIIQCVRESDVPISVPHESRESGTLTGRGRSARVPSRRRP